MYASYSNDECNKWLLNRIRGIEGAVSVSCGEAHALCKLKEGCLLAWGQNSCGQVGNGPSTVGYLSDAFRPVLIPSFGSYSIRNSKVLDRFIMRNCSDTYQSNLKKMMIGEVNHQTEDNNGNAYLAQDDVGGEDISVAVVDRAKLVCCGAFHSVCVNEKGMVWTWGARGSPCLGHNDSPIVGTWNSRINHVFSISTMESKVMVPFELLDWCLTWSMPRMVRSLAGGSLSHYYSDNRSSTSLAPDDGSISTFANTNVSAKQRIVQVCATDLCTSFLSEDGRLFLCGTGPTVPSFVSSRPKPDDPDDDNYLRRGDGVNDEYVGIDDDLDSSTSDQQQQIITIVSSPRCPSDSWLRELSTRRVTYIAGSGSKMFAVVDEEYAASMVTAPLLTNLLSTTTDDDVEHEQQQLQLRSLHLSDESSVSSLGARSNLESIFESRGKVDCMILASGKVFLCHKAFLAHRSPELRNMIIMESSSGNDINDHHHSGSAQVVQILLPELHREAAKALIYFLYRSVVAIVIVRNVSSS